MQREAKATHRRMLHQFAALWTKGMVGETVNAPILRLNDRCTLVEMAFTVYREGLRP